MFLMHPQKNVVEISAVQLNDDESAQGSTSSLLLLLSRARQWVSRINI